MRSETKICVALVAIVAIGVFSFSQFLLNLLLENWGIALAALGPSLAAMFYLCYFAIRSEREHRVERYITTAKREAERFKKRKGVRR